MRAPGSALRKALMCGPFPLGCGAAGHRGKVLALRWLAFGLAVAGSLERERSVAENSSSGRGPGPSGGAGVRGLPAHGSWRPPNSSVTNAELFAYASILRGAVAVSSF